jgi:hypothetical protein
MFAVATSDPRYRRTIVDKRRSYSEVRRRIREDDE